MDFSKEANEEIEKKYTSLLEEIGIAWWVEIVTEQPDCTYYFGPFKNAEEAKEHQRGYVEDLDQERPCLIVATVKQGKPRKLTIFEDEWEESVESHTELFYS